MADILGDTQKELHELGVSQASDIAQLFKLLQQELQIELAGITTKADVEAARIRWLGRKSGILTHVKNNWLDAAPQQWKRQVGLSFNVLKKSVEEQLQAAAVRGAATEMATGKAAERLDWTLPGNITRRGVRHVLTQTLEEITDIFVRLGYSVVEGPEIETAYYNFEALNMPAHHPARDMWDTLYLTEDILLRTHTSPVQIRAMEKQPPPLRIIAPGKVYRHDNPDATRSFMFHQVEGLAVGPDITFCDLKGTLAHFVSEFFGPKTRTRFVPSYFPFTEPSADVHGSCHVCGGTGCRVCKFAGWIELAGAGMVHPAVLRYGGYDPEKVSGFAFGMGLDRFAMLKYGIDNIQLFFENDVRFLDQFRR